MSSRFYLRTLRKVMAGVLTLTLVLSGLVGWQVANVGATPDWIVLNYTTLFPGDGWNVWANSNRPKGGYFDNFNFISSDAVCNQCSVPLSRVVIPLRRL